jgi:hypothetical protein
VCDAAGIGHGHLAIQHHGPAAGGNLTKDRAERSRVIEPLAAQQLDRTVAGNDRDQPPTVMLWFMQPGVAGRRLGTRT